MCNVDCKLLTALLSHIRVLFDHLIVLVWSLFCGLAVTPACKFQSMKAIKNKMHVLIPCFSCEE